MAIDNNGEGVRIMPGAQIIGNVHIGQGTSIWYNAVIRADEEKVDIGENTNIQDLVMIHVDREYPVKVGNGVTVGHGAILHGCTIEDNVLIGMGSIIMNGAHIGKNCIIGAGTLVPGGTEIEEGMVAFGNPVKVRRSVSEEEIRHIQESAETYARLSGLKG